MYGAYTLAIRDIASTPHEPLVYFLREPCVRHESVHSSSRNDEGGFTTTAVERENIARRGPAARCRKTGSATVSGDQGNDIEAGVIGQPPADMISGRPGYNL